MCSDIRHLTGHGWNVTVNPTAGPGVVVDADRTEGRTAPGLSVYHTDRDTAVAAAFAACIVIDGHDPLRLLNDCYQALPPGDLRSRVLGCLLNTPPGERHPGAGPRRAAGLEAAPPVPPAGGAASDTPPGLPPPPGPPPGGFAVPEPGTITRWPWQNPEGAA